MFTLEMLPAERGDAILVEYGSGAEPSNRVLIDGGPVNSGNYDGIRARLEQVPTAVDGRRYFDLLVISHVDTDHIEGVIRLLQDKKLRCVFDDVWFNGWKHLKEIDARAGVEILGGIQGEFLGALLQHQGRAWNQLVGGSTLFVPEDGELPRITLRGGMQLTLLSPTKDGLERLRKDWTKHVEGAGFTVGDAEQALKALQDKWWARPPTLGDEPIMSSEDSSMANLSSIAFLAEFGGRSVLLAADAHDDVLTGSLRRLRAERGLAGDQTDEPLPIDALKLSHHGSKNNTTEQLLSEIATDRYLISTSGDQFHHPNMETIKCILAHHKNRRVPTVCFNYVQDRFNFLNSQRKAEALFGNDAVVRLATD